MISPLGRTTSMPSTNSFVIPYFKTAAPPALVEIFPPIVQELSEGKESGKNLLFSKAIFLITYKEQPA